MNPNHINGKVHTFGKQKGASPQALERITRARNLHIATVINVTPITSEAMDGLANALAWVAFEGKANDEHLDAFMETTRAVIAQMRAEPQSVEQS